MRQIRLTRPKACLGLMAWVAAAALAAPTRAQVIERYAPQVPQAPAKPLILPDIAPQDQDPTPIGPQLSAIVLLDKDEAVRAAASPGIDLGTIQRLAPQAATVRQALSGYLGQPLSLKLIAQIETDLAKRYRALGYPFVAFFTPEQDISAGVLQVQVIEFRIGAVTVSGADKGHEKFVRRAIGLKSGDAINAKTLAQDLYWLNLYPFAQVQPVFAPAKAPAETDLSLVRTSLRPWQAYAGYENGGSPSSSWGRYFVGGAVGGLLGQNSVLSYQATSSADSLSAKAHPHYIGQVLNYTLPLARHGRLELNLNHVETNQNADPFTVQLLIDEVELAYGFGVNLPFMTGNTQVRLGVAGKRQAGQTLYAGFQVYKAMIDDPQFSASVSHSQADTDTASQWSIAVRALPNGLSRADDPARSLLYRPGQEPSAHYSYVTFNYSQQRDLNAKLVWRSQFIGQWADLALPRTEQAGLGGSSLVRGYNLDDGAYDQIAVWRNELALKTAVTVHKFAFQPYVFVDLGTGRDLYAKASRSLASIGIATELALDKDTSLKLAVADSLRQGVATLKNTGQAHLGLIRRF